MVGLIRVSNANLGPLGPYSLSPASLSDCDWYFNCANDTQVRLQSINNKSISYPEHLKWFRNTLASPLVLMFILKDRYSFPLGQIRFSRDHFDPTRIKISFSLDASARGHRLSSVLLSMGLDALRNSWNDITCIYAQVKIGNPASSRTFLSGAFLRLPQVILR